MDYYKPAPLSEIKLSPSCYSAKPYSQPNCVGCESRDVDFAEKILRVDRIRSKPDCQQPQTQAPTNIQLLCEAEIDIRYSAPRTAYN